MLEEQHWLDEIDDAELLDDNRLDDLLSGFKACGPDDKTMLFHHEVRIGRRVLLVQNDFQPRREVRP